MREYHTKEVVDSKIEVFKKIKDMEKMFGETEVLEEKDIIYQIASDGYTVKYVLSKLVGIMAASEAEERWGLKPGTVRASCTRGKLKGHEGVRKSGNTWLVTLEAMEEIYGKSKEEMKIMKENIYGITFKKEDVNTQTVYVISGILEDQLQAIFQVKTGKSLDDYHHFGEMQIGNWLDDINRYFHESYSLDIANVVDAFNAFGEKEDNVEYLGERVEKISEIIEDLNVVERESFNDYMSKSSSFQFDVHLEKHMNHLVENSPSFGSRYSDLNK